MPLHTLLSATRHDVVALAQAEWALASAEVRANCGDLLRRLVVAGFGLVLLAACLLMLLAAVVVALAERIGAANALLTMGGIALLLGAGCVALAGSGLARMSLLPRHTIARIGRDIASVRTAVARGRSEPDGQER